MKYLKPYAYKRGGRWFRYNGETSEVEWCAKATEEEYRENKNWIRKFGEPLWKIDEYGLMTVCSAGLHRSNWLNKEARDEYLDVWNEQIEEECNAISAAELSAFGALIDVL